jgi:membrane dipeptidase
MNYRIDNLQYCNWSRDIFKINRDAGLNAVHATVVYHEDYDEFLIKLKEWDNLFNENSDLIFLGKTFEDIIKDVMKKTTLV